ncbi:outer membrane beta-barrel protein [Terrimonas sp. NA20]|uniref:Outer membrane beta-barrel protein n=1 Tax=Terrimonas ginsenosidimutans TaxID=2908004 RepID=A0ABS9KMX6_9BACT|nr:outer membrane beta-barrel protein [Terrimonas ginsenosidimutans]MCG2613661.1 outer membrane beta-barrel protein [Terrimonas ginsenosidimutans]
MTSTHKRFKTAGRCFFLLACLFSASFLFAQKSPFSVALTTGVAFPTGKFAGKEFQPINAMPNENGAARPGLNTNLQINARISHGFFITLKGGISKYNRDTDKAQELYDMLYGPGKTKLKSERWEVIKLLAGPSLHLPVGNKLSFRTGIAAGITNTSVPSYKNEHSAQPGQSALTSRYDYDVDLSTAFAYQANAGLGYKIGQQLSLLFDVTYFGAKAKGTQIIYPITGGPGPGPGMQPTPEPIYLHHKYPLNAITALIGLEWQF